MISRVKLDGDALGYKNFPNHIRQGRRLAVFGAAPQRKSVGVKIGRAIELDYARGDRLRMLPASLRMLKKFGLDSLGIDSGRAVVMTLVPKHIDQFGRQNLIENINDRFTVGLVIVGHCAAFDND